jgi:K+-transporting ATPase c subunit
LWLEENGPARRNIELVKKTLERYQDNKYVPQKSVVGSGSGFDPTCTCSDGISIVAQALKNAKLGEYIDGFYH